MDNNSEFETLSEKFNSLCDESTLSDISHKEVKNIAKVATSSINYKKVSIIASGLYVLSFFLTYYVLDPKYYQENEKTIKRQFLFCSICIFLFLIIYYYTFSYILRKVLKN
jgi:hypothetical protein